VGKRKGGFKRSMAQQALKGNGKRELEGGWKILKKARGRCPPRPGCSRAKKKTLKGGLKRILEWRLKDGDTSQLRKKLRGSRNPNPKVHSTQRAGTSPKKNIPTGWGVLLGGSGSDQRVGRPTNCRKLKKTWPSKRVRQGERWGVILKEKGWGRTRGNLKILKNPEKMGGGIAVKGKSDTSGGGKG